MPPSSASRKASTTPKPDLGSLPTKKELELKFKKWFPRDDEPRTLEELWSLTSEQLADSKLGPTLDEYRMLSPRDGTKWTDQETHMLYMWRRKSENVPYEEIGRRLQRSELACRLRIHHLRDGKIKGFEHYDTSVLANRSGRRGPRGAAGAARSRRRAVKRTVAPAPAMTQPGPSQPQPAQSTVPSASQSGFRSINQPGQDNADTTETAQALLSFSQGAVKHSPRDEISTALAINKAARSDTPQQRPEDFSEPTSPHTGDVDPQWPSQRTFKEDARTSYSPESSRSPATTQVESKENSSALESKPVSERMSFARIMN